MICILFLFLLRMKSAEKTYMDAFEDELKGFVKRVEARAIARIEESVREAEEVSIFKCQLDSLNMFEEL